jgi:tetratricopeptide (TPR) repeat protein
MKRVIRLAVVVGGLAVIAWWFVRKSHRALPPLVEYPQLPPAFTRALQVVRKAAEGGEAGHDELARLARLYQANGFFAEAAACYAQIPLRKFVLSAEDHYLIADVALNRKDPATAQTELRASIAEERQYLPAHLRLAELLFETGDLKGAASEYEQTLKLDSENPTAALSLARIDLQRGNEAGAVQRLDRLLVAQPRFAEAASLLAPILERRGEKERAAAMRQMSRQTFQPRPSDPVIDAMMKECHDRTRLLARVEAYVRANRLDDAVSLLDRVEELDSKGWYSHLLRGWARARGSHNSEAILEYERALEAGGDAETVVPLIAQAYAGNARFADGLVRLKAFQEKYPDSGLILGAYAQLAMQGKQPALARELLTTLTAREPYLYKPNLDLANLCWNVGNKAEAVTCLQRVANVYVMDIVSRELLGRHFLEEGDPKLAIAPLEQALPQAKLESAAHEKITELLHTALMTVGEIDMTAERFEPAADAFGKAVAIWPTDLDALTGKADACIQLKRWAEAAETLKTVLSLQPDNPAIFMRLGDVLYQNGDVETAKARWERALRLASAGKRVDLQGPLERRLSGPITPDLFLVRRVK